MKMLWDYQNFHGQIKHFEPAPETKQLWWMQSFERGQAIPHGAAMKDDVVFLKPGEELQELGLLGRAP